MEEASKIVATSRLRRVGVALLFCALCVTMNYLGMKLASVLGLPLYLDCIGTILAATIGGYLPGVLVGYFTNLINCLTDPVSLYYSVISVMIAASATTFARHGWFRSVPKTLVAILVFAFFGGGLASVLTWNLYGFSTGNDTTSSFVVALRNSTSLTPFLSQLSGDYLIDLLDKAISVVCALAITRLLPQPLTDYLELSWWQQRPLDENELADARKTRPRQMSFATKIGIIVSVIMAIVAVVTTSISFVLFNKTLVSEETLKAEGVTNLAIKAIDPTRIDEFLEKGEEAEGYLECEQALAEIRDSFEDMRYLYVYRVLDDGCHVVLDPDTADEAGSDPGDVVDFDVDFEPYLADLLAGRPIPAVFSDGAYGWLLTVYQPVLDDQGVCQCYVAADIDMSGVVSDTFLFLTKVVSLFGAFFILIFVVVLWLVDYSIILPVNSISLAMSRFAFDTVSDRTETVKQVRDLAISTGDEIENLYDAAVKTAEDTVGYIQESEEKTATIARMQDNLIMVMADLVESRDQYTGDHVRKTATYALIIMEQMMSEGIYADQLSPDFVSAVYHSAPLHDIGKIVVSDTILNKPARLTDEEFAVMQGHTTAGREIIERAKGAVSQESYLDEAVNLAEYHHEKWAGGGYPTGIAGEDIPLSARIMAVADVFDALVSKRSYKDGFPLEKAYAIIEAGSGTHFDPQIVRAFMDARKEVENVVRNFGDGQTDRELPDTAEDDATRTAQSQPTEDGCDDEEQ